MNSSHESSISHWLSWQIVDSAFPTGAFAHSWGLEAAWQHGEIPDADALRRFLRASIQQAGRGTLPLVSAAYRRPERLAMLDERADAILTNVVANRASRVQGRTFVSTAARIWPSPALLALEQQAGALCAHIGPISGVTLREVGVSLEIAQRSVLYGVARGVLSAAVRLGIAGSYEAQRLQSECAPWLEVQLARCASLGEDDVAQTAPILDLVQARHDRLYSRLFQS